MNLPCEPFLLHLYLERSLGDKKPIKIPCLDIFGKSHRTEKLLVALKDSSSGTIIGWRNADEINWTESILSKMKNKL